MRILTMGWAASAVVAMVGLAGCQVNTDKNGDHNDVKIATPFGGMQVKTDDKVVPSEVGLPVYPGATIVHKEGKDTGSADVNMSFGNFKLRVKAVSYRTPDSPDKVEAFYRDGLKKYGDVIACRGEKAVGTPTQTSDGLTCSDKKGNHITVDEGGSSHSLELKTGSRQHQHVVGIDSEGSGTKIGLVALDLPGRMFSDDSKGGGERQ